MIIAICQESAHCGNFFTTGICYLSNKCLRWVLLVHTYIDNNPRKTPILYYDIHLDYLLTEK
jgi:hypothetical protein